jgi:SAM-dependent methyltransferase
VLDVGAGESPWRDWLSDDAEYTGLDIESAASFGMAARADVIYFSGEVFPFTDGSFDAVLCIEVLEHVPSPRSFLAEVFRVCRPGASLLLTVPWSARRHHIPFDFFRFTPEALIELLRSVGFDAIEVRERGNDIGAIANKLVVLSARLMKPRGWLSIVYGWPLGLVCLPIAGVFVLAHHLSVWFEYQGGKEDPLGFAVVARRSNVVADANPV